MRMTCTLFTETPAPNLMEFAYPDFEAAVDFGLARRTRRSRRLTASIRMPS